MKMLFLAALACATMALGACSDNDDNDAASATEDVVPGTNHKVLIAYFSEPLPDGTDANTSASRVVAGNRLYGSVEYMATVIGKATGGDMVRIQTETPYPGNFDDLAAQADNERQNGIHPTLSTSIEGFDNYDVVFVGYPIWWYQMPMPMYSFFDRYDFPGNHHTVLFARRKRMVGHHCRHCGPGARGNHGRRFQHLAQQRGFIGRRNTQLAQGHQHHRMTNGGHGTHAYA